MVLAGLVIGHLLKEQSGPLPVGILDRRTGVPLFGWYADLLEELVPDRVDIAQHVAPERRQGSRITGVKGDLYVSAHDLIIAAAGAERCRSWCPIGGEFVYGQGESRWASLGRVAVGVGEGAVETGGVADLESMAGVADDEDDRT